MTARRRSQRSETQHTESEAPRGVPAKKKFVEPEISHPVDVLEATTYFQAVESGATN
jgi:hypothetical protein